MTRRRKGKLSKLSDDERVKRQERNERRKRNSTAMAWAKEHIVKPKENIFKGVNKRTGRRTLMEDAITEALREVPAIDDSRRGKR
jgi:hypothetical protein